MMLEEAMVSVSKETVFVHLRGDLRGESLERRTQSGDEPNVIGFEGNPVDEGTKRRGLTPSCIVGKARKFHIQIDKWLVTP